MLDIAASRVNIGFLGSVCFFPHSQINNEAIHNNIHTIQPQSWSSATCPDSGLTPSSPSVYASVLLLLQWAFQHWTKHCVNYPFLTKATYLRSTSVLISHRWPAEPNSLAVIKFPLLNHCCHITNRCIWETPVHSIYSSSTLWQLWCRQTDDD